MGSSPGRGRPRARDILRTGIPTVNLNSQVRGLGLPQIHSDHEAIARLAAEHLLERGFRHFAYWLPGLRMVGAATGGPRRVHPGRGRRVPRERTHAPGAVGPPAASWEGEVNGAARWIRSCPSRWACSPGTPAQHPALDACRRAGVAVPEEVAVVGVDNDELVCELAYPPLSSVIPGRRIGYEASPCSTGS